jgi:16S rRNA processing protein RimM
MGGPLVALARVGAPHGVRGEVSIVSYTAEPQAFASYGPLQDPSGRRHEVVAVRLAGGKLIARLKGVESRDRAAALTGTELLVPRSVLPAPGSEDDFYLADLVGVSVATADGRPFGRVAAVENHGAGDILAIARDGGATELFAFTKRNFPSVDLAQGRIVIDPPLTVEAKDGAS